MKRLLKAIVLPVLLLLGIASFAQDKVVTGKVTDSKTGAGLAGVSVTVKGTRIGTSTGADGSYTITVPASASTLVISSSGFTQQEVKVAGSSADISLVQSQLNLSEIVVVGYGTVKKKDLTGSVNTVSSKDFQKGAVTTPEQLILGKVPGVSIISNGGAPGSGSTIRIRGGASLNASNEPLIVIDGVPITPLKNSDGTPSISGSPDPLSLINPNDIETFTILKDASATAIYGSRASNGVILITTKKGRSGKPKFNFNTQLSISKAARLIDIFTPDEFRNFVNGSGKSDEIAKLGTASTDWQDLIYQTAVGTDNNLSVSGGLKNMPYRVSLGYLNQTGLLRTGRLERYSGGVNLNPKLLDDHLRIDINLKASMSKSRFANQDAIGAAVQYDPTYPVYSGSNRFGGYFEVLDPSSATGLKALAPRNPLGLLYQKEDISDVTRSIGNILFDYKVHFLPDLHVNLNLGYDYSKGKGTKFIPDSAAARYKRYKDFGGENTEYLQKKTNKLLEFYLNYAKDIKSIDSRVEVVAGYAYQDFINRTDNFADRTSNDTIVSVPTFAFDEPENVLISYYGRLNYSLKNRYMLTATIRTDGSSKFSEDNRWGVFPSAALAWNIKEESFLRNSRTFSGLKLRVGYGITGQQEGIGLYDYRSFYALSNNLAQYQLGDNFYNMMRPAGYYPKRKWEQTATSNIALDFGILNNRVSGSIDVYYKKTTDLLNEIDQSAGQNFSNKIIANVGDMENRGIEISLNTTPIKRKDLQWDFGFNFTYNKNEITKLTISEDPNNPGNKTGDISGGTGQRIQINSVGFPRNSFYVFKQVYDAQGNPIDNVFEDINRDGVVNDLDLYRYQSPDADVLMGFTSQVSYKQWSAGFIMRASLGNYMYNNVFSNSGMERNIYNPLGYLNNGSTNVLDSKFSGSGDLYSRSDYYVENASFLRMDNINVGYDAGKVFKNAGRLRITGAVQNVFVITKYKGLDPEISSGIDKDFYPRPRTFVLGLNLDF